MVQTATRFPVAAHLLAKACFSSVCLAQAMVPESGAKQSKKHKTLTSGFNTKAPAGFHILPGLLPSARSFLFVYQCQ
jgi:hypothetical protein